MNKYNIKKELEILSNNKINSVYKIPSSSTIYNILKLNNLNKLDTEMIGNSRNTIQR
ncbi:MAG TPA: hypothetical protein VLL98_04040 [Rickettsiales bacterium]|nr:hypothetical protein [Rickettsiales bacterium]